MRSRRLTKWLVLGAVPATVTMMVVPAGIAAASSAATAGAQQYVVFLKTQSTGSVSARAAAARRAQAPLAAQIKSLGAHVTGTTTAVSAVFATMTASQAQAVAANPAVELVAPNGIIHGATAPSISTGGGNPSASPGATAPNTLCGTASDPQLNPEALYNINAEAPTPGADGAGVKVALIADGLNPADPDFSRNAAFASTGSAAGSPVVTEEDFSSDGTNAATPGGEAFLDASSIAAQGNTAYDLSQYVSSAHPLPAGCDIKIQGVAPGASVLALKAFAENNDTTTSGFVQAINYAVAHGVKVINESFGSNNFPDLTADATRIADDDAVAAGVTVVVSTGDGGLTSTIGSPATDPNVISVGASTTFRAFEQFNFGGINDPAAKPGQYLDNNVAAISSGGMAENGSTVDLLAPGDWNWALCDTNITLYTDCTNESGTGSPIQFTGGTSEASPLTAGAAADVIQAYRGSHGGASPSPALVKRILMSTATDINSPATEQGAGLLNVTAAVAMARSIGAHGGAAGGGVLVSQGQVDVQQKPGATTNRTIAVTNTSNATIRVRLGTRQLTNKVASHSGEFCMQPGTPTSACPANTGVFPIWSGVAEVYQNVTFNVPRTTGTSRLDFTTDYQYTGQTSLLHVALIEPNGTYAAYDDPQGLADFGAAQVSNPPAGKWTAVFFTEQNGATSGGVGTSGPVQWNATTLTAVPGSRISPSAFTLHPGQTGDALLRVKSPSAAGDTSESVVISAPGQRTSVPVAIRTIIPTNRNGGSFHGVLTGGNGRADTQAEANDYVFDVPKHAKGLDISVKLANDPNDLLIAQLIAPDGEDTSYTTNVTYLKKIIPADAFSTRFANLYHANPAAGQWTLLLAWQNPVSGLELSEPFSGQISFAAPATSSTLPRGSALKRGKLYTFKVRIHNSGPSPEWYFADPRKNTNETISLLNQNGNVASTSKLTLPLAEPSAGLPFPYYLVPSDSRQLTGRLTSTVPVNFDMEYFPGDPDLEGVRAGHEASLTVSAPQLSSGLWLLNPDEVGPYPATGAPAAKASASVKVTTQAFDSNVGSSTGDIWSLSNGIGKGGFTPVYVPSGGTATIKVSIRATTAVGSREFGDVYIDDVAVAGFTGIFGLPSADQIVAIPFSYRVVR